MPPPDVVERDRKKPGDRPRTNDGLIGDDDALNEPDPRRTGIGLLDAAEEFLQQPQTPQDITTPTERPSTVHHRRNPRDDDLRPLRPVSSPAEEEEIIPGNPDDLGARGKRRGSKDEVNASPVLRRGLLGV